MSLLQESPTHEKGDGPNTEHDDDDDKQHTSDEELDYDSDIEVDVEKEESNNWTIKSMSMPIKLRLRLKSAIARILMYCDILYTISLVRTTYIELNLRYGSFRGLVFLHRKNILCNIFCNYCLLNTWKRSPYIFWWMLIAWECQEQVLWCMCFMISIDIVLITT